MEQARLSAGPTPPREFLIFTAGWTDTYKGRFLFDEEAATVVMANYAEHGVERPIDLEHLSIDDSAENYDPDARGWFKLAVRNGELWAVDVRWTPDGDRRLRQCTQRYISPFFDFDKKSRRVQSLYNVAICAIPATKDMPALVAASARSKLELVALSIEANDMEYKKILAALGLGDDASLEDALGAIKAFQEDDGGNEEGAKLRKMLALGDDAPFEDVEAALKKLNIGGGDDPEREENEPEKTKDDPEDKDEDEKEMAKLSPKLQGMFLGMKASIDTLTKQVGSLAKKQTKSEVEQLIADNTDRIPLHMEPFLKNKPIEVVQEFLKHSIPTPRAKTPPKDTTKGNEALSLTKDEKELAKLSGVSEEDQLKFKKSRIEKDRQRAGQSAD